MKSIKVNWSSELINQCLEILGCHSDTDEALCDIVEQTGLPITYNKLRHAFAKFCLGKPQTHLSRTMLVRDIANELEFGTRPANLGGLGRAESTILANIEDRLGISLEDLDMDLKDEMKVALTQLLNDNRRKKSATREARSRINLEDRLAALTTAFVKQSKLMASPFDRIVLEPSTSGHSTVLLTSIADAHIGKVWIDRDGVTRLDKEINRSRIATITSDTIEYANRHNVEKVILWWGGDIWESPLGNMRKNQQSKMDLIGKDAFEEAKNLVVSQAKAIQEECLGVKEIQILLTGGNHDRLTEEKEYSSEDFMMYMFGSVVAALLPECKVRVLPPVASVVVHSTELLLLHGHRNKLGNEMQIRRLVENQSATSLRKLILQGHYHSFRAMSGRKWDCITLPSVCGCDDFVQYDINQYSEAKYCMFAIEENQWYMIGPKTLE